LQLGGDKILDLIQAVVLKLNLTRDAAIAGDFRRVVASTELAAADTELFRRKQRLAEGGLRSCRQVRVEPVHDFASTLNALEIDLQIAEVGFSIDS
jgi:hypothetical protein